MLTTTVTDLWKEGWKVEDIAAELGLDIEYVADIIEEACIGED